MDPELIAYLDARFRETSQQIESLREETTYQMGVSREETTQQISVLRGETTQQIGGLAQQFERLEKRMEEGFRHTGIEIEALRGDIRQVAEGVIGANERLDSFRESIAVEFKEVRASIRTPFENLDGRARILETQVFGKTPRKGKSRPPS
jgi:hypothetical protein